MLGTNFRQPLYVIHDSFSILLLVPSAKSFIVSLFIIQSRNYFKRSFTTYKFNTQCVHAKLRIQFTSRAGLNKESFLCCCYSTCSSTRLGQIKPSESWPSVELFAVKSHCLIRKIIYITRLYYKNVLSIIGQRSNNAVVRSQN